MSHTIISIDDDNFDESVLSADLPVLVDFWASWCGPCRMLKPIFEELSVQYAGRVKFASMDVDQSQDTPAKYGVRGIPTLILFKRGQVAAQQSGFMNNSQLEKWIDSHL